MLNQTYNDFFCPLLLSVKIFVTKEKRAAIAAALSNIVLST